MWTYDSSDLNTTTASGRLNAVRYLVGDTNTTDQQVDDEEINFGLSENKDNVYRTAAWVAQTLASKYARYVDIDLDGQVAESYDQLYKHYSHLVDDLNSRARANGSIGMVAGGISLVDMKANRRNTDRPKSFYVTQYDNPQGDYKEDDYL